MSQEPHESPSSGIRTVFLAGFFTGNIVGFVYLALTGVVLYLLVDPYALLALLGAFMGVGVVGMGLGGIAGLALRLVLEQVNPSFGWRAPIILSGVVSAVVGLLTAITVASLLL